MQWSAWLWAQQEATASCQFFLMTDSTQSSPGLLWCSGKTVEFPEYVANSRAAARQGSKMLLLCFLVSLHCVSLGLCSGHNGTEGELSPECWGFVHSTSGSAEFYWSISGLKGLQGYSDMSQYLWPLSCFPMGQHCLFAVENAGKAECSIPSRSPSEESWLVPWNILSASHPGTLILEPWLSHKGVLPGTRAYYFCDMRWILKHLFLTNIWRIKIFKWP